MLGANILGGKGKLQFLMELISETVGTPCKYCSEVITLRNLSLDHKVPYLSTEDRRQKAKNKAKRAYADRRDNLHIVCVDCNSVKGQMSHDDFSSLLAWAATRGPEMIGYIRRKLSQSRSVFSIRRDRGQVVSRGSG